MKTTKSQITLLILIGLVIVVMFVFFIYLAMSATKKQAELNIEKSQQGKATVRQVEEFVRQCLDKTAKGGLVMLGKQGGVIYVSQNGLHPDFVSDQENILYKQVGDKSCKGDKGEICFVPYGLVVINQNTDPEQQKRELQMARATDIEDYEPSIESQLGYYVSQKISECTNEFESFEKQGFKVTLKGSVTSNAFIGENDVKFRLNMPIEVENKITKAKSNYNEFSATIKVRLLALHEKAKVLIDNEISKPDFKIHSLEADGITIAPPLNQLQSKRGQDDIITLIDWKFGIDGSPFKFQFVRANRKPQFSGTTGPSCISDSTINLDGTIWTERKNIEPIGAVAYDYDEEDEDTPLSPYKERVNGQPYPTQPTDKVNLPAEIKFEVNDGSKTNGYTTQIDKC